jgi:hypothetical protein
MSRRIAAAFAAALLLLLPACAAEAAPEATPAGEVFTPVLAEVMAPPIATEATDGDVHLAYELQLTNILSQRVGLSELVVMSGDEDELLRLSGPALAAQTLEIAGGLGADALQPGRGAIVFVDVAVPKDAVPETLTHLLTVAPDAAQPPIFDSPLTEAVATTTVDTTDPVVVGSPVRGANWLDGNSCCAVTPHRTAVNAINGSYHVPERYAIDFARLDKTGRIFDGPITDMASYAYEGADIHAVADGEIVSMLWDVPETPPGAHPTGLTLAQYGGNHVVQDIGDGRYAFYAHLQPDNPLKLEVGQRLGKGDVIGHLGNSGNTDLPHLHFHIMDSPLPLASNGLPFRFDDMTLAGTVSEDQLTTCIAAPLPCVMNSDAAGDADRLSPLYRDVLDFPE